MAEHKEIARYHSLTSVNVRPGMLVLDPSNPRINLDVGADLEYLKKNILSDSVQNDLLHRICKDGHHVKQLKNNIKKFGFIAGSGIMIVEKIQGADKYKVLEGNRRTAAIKLLLTEKGIQSKTVNETMTEFEVKEFRYKENPQYKKEEVIRVLLGMIHVSGAEAWGSMEIAKFLYDSYCSSLKRSSGAIDGGIDAIAVKKIADYNNRKESDIRKNLRIYRVFEQLKKEGYNVESKKYSLIELSTGNRHLRKTYFHLDASYGFSDIGLSRFNNLCLENNSPIKNPENFNKFRYVQRYGSEKNVEEIENRLDTVESVYQKVRAGKEEKKVLDQLRDILLNLKRLNICGFAGDKAEREVVDDIVNVVNIKLRNVVMVDVDGLDIEEDEWALPTDKIQLMSIESDKMQWIIKETFCGRPNNSCVKGKLAGFVLGYLGIITSGLPRIAVINRINQEIEEMIRGGLLREYQTSKNVRVELLIG